MKIISVFGLVAKNSAIKTIKLYQKTISFDHSVARALYPHGFCKFNPTCSQYAIDAITGFGLGKGAIIALWRVIRCHPFSRGGHDPIKRPSR